MHIAERENQNLLSHPDIETASGAYARRFQGAVGAWLLRFQEEAVLSMLAPWPRARVLEVGGAHGQLTSALVREGFRVSIFSSRGCPTQQIERFLEQGQCELASGDLLNLPYPDRSFDVVIALRLLTHMPQWQRLMAELTRVARHAVVVDYPTGASINVLYPLLFWVKRCVDRGSRPFRVFRTSELLGTFETHGFTLGQRYPQFALPMALHRTLRSPGFSQRSEHLCRSLGLTEAFGSPVILQLVRNGQGVRGRR